MSRILLLTTLVVYTSFRCIFAQNSDLQRELKEADFAIENKQYEMALQHVNSVLSKSPYYLDALEKKINIFFLKNQEKDLFKEVELLIKQNPHQPEYFYMRAILQLHRTKYSKAIDDFNASLDFEMPLENQYKVYLNRGVSHFQYQDYELAEDDFKKALDLKPGYVPIFQSWGMLKYETKDYDKAVEYFVKAIQIEDSNPTTYYNLGMAYYRLDEPDNACYYFNKSCSMGQRNACKLLFMECADEINLPQ